MGGKDITGSWFQPDGPSSLLPSLGKFLALSSIGISELGEGRNIQSWPYACVTRLRLLKGTRLKHLSSSRGLQPDNLYLTLLKSGTHQRARCSFVITRPQPYAAPYCLSSGFSRAASGSHPAKHPAFRPSPLRSSPVCPSLSLSHSLSFPLSLPPSG